MKRSAVIVSEYASDNLGDQAICRSLKGILSPYFDIKLLIFSGLGQPVSVRPLFPTEPKPSADYQELCRLRSRQGLGGIFSASKSNMKRIACTQLKVAPSYLSEADSL